MATEAKTANYWISSTALYIQLNAMGEPDYTQCSVVSGASILCYMQGVKGLEYDAGHNYQRWPLAAYPSIFPDSKKKYVYAAIPRQRLSDTDQATIVFPGQRIDLYGKAILTTKNEDGSTVVTEGEQIGNEQFYYIFLQGIISEVKTGDDGVTRMREWQQHVDCGSLATDEALASGGEGQWWKYNSVSDTVTFLKTIQKADFEALAARSATITKLILDKSPLTGVATAETLENSNEKIVTPVYLGLFGEKHFLAKDKDDVAHGTITFEKMQKFLQGLTADDLSQFKKGATFGEFIQGILFGTGARIDGLGNAEFESITSRSSIIAKELIVNRQTAMESNFVFTESGLVEKVTEHAPESEGDNTTYTLQLQKRWENDFTAFKENDVILASINTLLQDGKYYDMWLRVLSVNTVKNTIDVVCYPDNEVPSQKNYPPCELARLIRWGNAVKEDRQSCWYISSSEGLLVWLDHVTKPIIDKSNYSVAIGKLPDALHFIFANYPLADKRDGAFYAKYLAVQNIIRTDYEGNVKQDVVDRGKWSPDTAKGENPYRCTTNEVHDVWHYGCRWRCLEDKTQKEPKYSGTGWAFVEGNPEFTIDVTSSEGWRFSRNYIFGKRDDLGELAPFTTIHLYGKLYNQDVTEYLTNIVWTRDTGDPAKDNQWAQQIAQRKDQLTLPLKGSDLGEHWSNDIPCVFKVTAEIHDGEVYQTDLEIVF